jgi:hypothetical protein
MLGDFEEDLSGWKTTGGASLSRVSASEFSIPVCNGQWALEISPNGDTVPTIRRRLSDFGDRLQTAPYFASQVVASGAASNGLLGVKLRYQHSAPNAGESSDDVSPTVEEVTRQVPIDGRSAVVWNLSELAAEKLANPTAIELAFSADGSFDPNGNSNDSGKQQDGAELDKVYVDGIHLRESSIEHRALGYLNHRKQLRAAHGANSYEPSAFFDGGEEGVITYADGFEITKRWEDIGPDQDKITLGDRVHHIGGGWE